MQRPPCAAGWMKRQLCSRISNAVQNIGQAAVGGTVQKVAFACWEGPFLEVNIYGIAHFYQQMTAD
jgi:hypothetical protein